MFRRTFGRRPMSGDVGQFGSDFGHFGASSTKFGHVRQIWLIFELESPPMIIFVGAAPRGESVNLGPSAILHVFPPIDLGSLQSIPPGRQATGQAHVPAGWKTSGCDVQRSLAEFVRQNVPEFIAWTRANSARVLAETGRRGLRWSMLANMH